jgi:hypothetical protein
MERPAWLREEHIKAKLDARPILATQIIHPEIDISEKND